MCVLRTSLATFVLLALSASQAKAQDDRTYFLIHNADRAYISNGYGWWTNYIDGQQRSFREIGRNRSYVELYSAAPVPTWVRLTYNRVYWRSATDRAWNTGRPGGWTNGAGW